MTPRFEHFIRATLGVRVSTVILTVCAGYDINYAENLCHYFTATHKRERAHFYGSTAFLEHMQRAVKGMYAKMSTM